MTLAHDFTPTTEHDELAEAMTRHGVRMTYAKDEEIFAQDDDADLIYQVVSGAVRTTRLTYDGRRQVAGFYYGGELFGLEPGDAHRFSAEALCDTVVLVLRRSAVGKLAGDGRLARSMPRALSAELDRTQNHLLLLGRKTACEKVASFLQDMAERAGRAAVDLPMSRQDMADFLGLTIETVSRMLTQLQSTKVVEFAGCRQFRVCNASALDRLAA